jgi:hypothetical protein
MLGVPSKSDLLLLKKLKKKLQNRGPGLLRPRFS